MSILHASMSVSMPDGSLWAIPVNVIAMHRAKHYAYKFDGLSMKSLEEETVPLFESSEFEIVDWAENNMNWSDISQYARLINTRDIDFQEGWLSGDKKIRRKTL